VDVATVPAPLSTSGGGTEATALRVTLASDSTGLVSVDDNGGSLTVDGTVAVSGVVDTELPTAAALGEAEAAATAVPSVGARLMGYDGTDWNRIRVDPATFRIETEVEASVLPTGAATAALQLPDGHAVTVDNAAGASAVNIQDGGNSITVDGTVGVSGAVDTELPAAAALADNTANPTAPAVGAFGQVWDGATWDRSPGNSTDGTLVNLGANNDVTDAAAEASLAIMDDWDESDRAKVNIIAGQAGVAAGVGATGADVQRVVQANGGGKTILSAGGSAAGSGNNTLVAAGTNRLKVVAFSLTTTSTTAMTCIFQSGASGTELWRVIIQAPTGASAGANLSIALPGWLFATASATLLNLNLSSANAVHWSVTYYDEA
jgi:hypothetical protein